jgi:hypothetical protein
MLLKQDCPYYGDAVIHSGLEGLQGSKLLPMRPATTTVGLRDCFQCPHEVAVIYQLMSFQTI